MPKVLPKRTEVPVEHTWNITNVFPSDADWEKAVHEVNEDFSKVERYSGKLGDSAATLLKALQARDELMNKAWRVYLYAGMQLAGDRTNQDYTARNEQADSMMARAGAATAYFEPEILDIEPKRLESMVKEESGLATYRHYFDTINRRRGHFRSPEVESLLAEVTDIAGVGYRAHQALEDADMKFATIKDEDNSNVEVAQGNVNPLIQSQNREVRKAAWEAYADGYLAMKNTFASTLSGAIKTDIFYARARNYPSALEASLAPYNVPVEVYNNVLATFRKKVPVWHRYFEIRKRALGVDELHAYDIHVPLLRSVRNIPYQKATEMIIEGMGPLGEEYTKPLRQGLDKERWVDIYPNQGKGSGAFSWGVRGTHPFLMLNYDDTMLEVSTLAHELGHSMHSYLTWQNQPYVYSDYSMFAAETASNFNQALVRAHLLENNPDPDFQLEVLAEAMANFYRYLFIMPTLALFELDCHQRVERGEGLTADLMTGIMADLFSEGFGGKVAVDQPRVGITWAQFPHLYANFYVFQYTTGISAANALALGVLREGEPAAKRYLDFLKAGSSAYPIDALKLAGIDMSTPEPVEKAFQVLDGLLDRLDQLVGKGPLRPANLNGKSGG
jgi:oligoendopeptidase F